MAGALSASLFGGLGALPVGSSSVNFGFDSILVFVFVNEIVFSFSFISRF